MNKLKDSELILTSSGRIYHLNLKEEEVSDNIILVGDPERVKQISQKLKYNIIQSRDFIVIICCYILGDNTQTNT